MNLAEYRQRSADLVDGLMSLGDTFRHDRPDDAVRLYQVAREVAELAKMVES